MKNSLIIVFFFVAGIFWGRTGNLPSWVYHDKAELYALYVLLLLVGINAAADPNTDKLFSKLNKQMMAVPLLTIIGTYAGVALVALCIKNLKMTDALAIGSGFGYYSLSSVLISEIRNEQIGVTALFANIFREIFTLLFTPLLVKYFGKLAPVSSGGATSMDTTLPLISKYSGKEYVVVSIFHGLLLSLLVPVMIALIYAF